MPDRSPGAVLVLCDLPEEAARVTTLVVRSGIAVDDALLSSLPALGEALVADTVAELDPPSDHREADIADAH